ncbi:hypothetical protein RI367_002557 [Sorochytrium milnesiophthora]
MVQSFNRAGVGFFFRVLANRRLAVPNHSVADVRDIDFMQLRQRGISHLVFDKDNCLTAPYESHIYPPFEGPQKTWKQCLDVFGRDAVAIYSNSAGTDDDVGHAKAIALEQALHVPVIRHSEKKPAGGSSVVEHFGVAPDQIAFIGDRLLTDVVFARVNGFYSIHTRNIISRAGDNTLAAMIRDVENRWLYGKATQLCK